MRQSLITSILRAVRGIALAFTHEPNMRRECAAGLLMLILLFALPLALWERLLLLVVAALVLVVELVNTTLERLLNIVKPQFHEEVRDSKDMAAGAVLIASALALAVGVAIFGPYALFMISHV